jgi:iron(III) transport system substrate-binding protein
MTMRVLRITGALLLTVAAACAPAPAAQPSATAKQMSVAELAAYQGADRQKLLEEGARKEGTVSWYTSLAGDIIDRHAEAFRAKYPFVKVEIFRGAENELVTKITQETQAQQPSFDVLESQISAIKLLFDAKVMTPYYSPNVAAIPDDFRTKLPSGLYESATDRISLISFGYNTNLIPASAVPKTLNDLMNPALRGKLSVTGTTTGQRWVGMVLNQMGDDRGKQWLADFGAQQKVTVQQVSGQALLDLIAKGEVPASPTIFRDHVDLAATQKKAPVKWVPLEPAVGNTGQVGMALKAPHPYAALLFIDYLFADGAKVFHDNQYTTATDKLDFKVWVPERGKTTEQIDKDTKLWSDVFKSVFR